MIRSFILLITLFSAVIAQAALPSLLRGNSQGINLVARGNATCFPAELQEAIARIRDHFGTIRIHSAHRGHAHNRRVGGAHHSQHLTCKAMDFTVPGKSIHVVRKWVSENFAGVGGLGFYCGRSGNIHLDFGPPRTWGGCGPRGLRQDFARNFRSRIQKIQVARAAIRSGASIARMTPRSETLVAARSTSRAAYTQMAAVAPRREQMFYEATLAF